MSWSMNEVEALAKKAARGAGMSWGFAEETGKATRCLLVHGIAVTEPLAELLALQDGMRHSALAPLDIAEVWSAPGGRLCPIAAGTCLSDFAWTLEERAISMGAVAYPVFLIPFAQMAARSLGRAVSLKFDGVEITVSATEIRVPGDDGALLITGCQTIQVSLAPRLSGHPLPQTSRAEIAPETAACLTQFAHRTYAPATEESRLAGAGSGLTDND